MAPVKALIRPLILTLSTAVNRVPNQKTQAQPMVRPPGQGMSKNAKRRRKNKLLGVNGAGTAPTGVPVSTSAPANVYGSKRQRDFNKQGRGGNMRLPKVTEDGELFLKCAFASPDFAEQNRFKGIPDSVGVDIVPYSTVFTGDLGAAILRGGGTWPTTDDGTITAIVQLPVPGVAFYFAQSNPTGTFATRTYLRPVFYDDFASMFNAPIGENGQIMGPSDRTFDRFRIACNALELVCTSNSTRWSGSIRCQKLNVTVKSCNAYDVLDVNLDDATPLVMTVCHEGLQGIASTSTPNFLAPANLGAYMVATSIDGKTFPVTDVLNYAADMENGSQNTNFIIKNRIPGFSSLTTNVMLLEGTNAGNLVTNFSVRTWQSSELIPTTSTGNDTFHSNMLTKVAIPSPELDAMALMIYNDLQKKIPIAVTYAENATFWETVKKIAGTAMTVASTVASIAKIISML